MNPDMFFAKKETIDVNNKLYALNSPIHNKNIHPV